LLHHEPCSPSLVMLNEKVVFWTRESERGDLRVSYNGKRVGFFFRLVSSYVAGVECSVVHLSRFFFPFPHHFGSHSLSLFPTGLTSIFVAYVSHKTSKSNLPHPRSCSISSRLFSCSNRPTIGIRRLAAKVSSAKFC
jgi:hypothetical protein